MFWESRTNGNTSYIFAGDLNGDGGTSNDLIYMPRDMREMNFQTITRTAASPTRRPQQAEAWDAFIEQDAI